MIRSDSYDLALVGREGVRSRFEEICMRLKQSGRGNALRSFRAVLSRGRAAINMPISKLVKFLEEGEYLSFYEFVSREEGLSGEDLLRSVQERLQEFGPLRQKIDQLLRFKTDTHYASFNLGGVGARRYGTCCVAFDLRHWATFCTCYAGDSIRSCFLKTKDVALSDREILEGFATGEDLSQLATIHWEPSLGDPLQDPYFHPSQVRSLVEAEDSLLEIHLHGPVRRDHILEILLAQGDYQHLQDLVRRARGRSILPWEFDEVEPFIRMLDLLERFELPLVLAEN